MAPTSKIGRTDFGAVNFCVGRNGGDFPSDGQMGALTHELGLADAEALGEGIEAHHFGLVDRGDAVGAVAVHPFHMVVLLAGYFDELAEKILVGGGKFHGP